MFIRAGGEGRYRGEGHHLPRESTYIARLTNSGNNEASQLGLWDQFHIGMTFPRSKADSDVTSPLNLDLNPLGMKWTLTLVRDLVQKADC